MSFNSLICLVQAARETGALKEAKDKLEKTVEDLTWRLQLEKRLRRSSENGLVINTETRTTAVSCLPVAACITYKCLLQWRSFEVERTSSFRGTPQGVNLSFVNGSLTGGVDKLRQVEAKYPALLFKQQLTAYVEKIYGMIRDNLKKEISPLLGLCIQVNIVCFSYMECLFIDMFGSFPYMKMQAPRTSRASLVKGTSRSLGNAAGQQALIAHWQGIVKSLDSFLNTLKANHVSLLSIHIAKFFFMVTFCSIPKKVP
ncbi:hypothetical protein BHE74_00016765 [Ensete ventricosum]|nr:hypothetical protein BHE74_00016765 [Ensete ventricosum]